MLAIVLLGGLALGAFVLYRKGFFANMSTASDSISPPSVPVVPKPRTTLDNVVGGIKGAVDILSAGTRLYGEWQDVQRKSGPPVTPAPSDAPLTLDQLLKVGTT